jgi:PAS domain S-box-containing protein
MSLDLKPPPARTTERAVFRLLVVDDDLATIRQLGQLLIGFAQVSFATSGEDALAMARTQRPDLILLDAEMPGLSGFEVFKALRADALTAAVPVVFATSHTEPDVEAAALRMGAADFISKPLVPSQVLARVRRQLQRRERPAPAADAARPVSRVLIVDDDPATIQLLQGLLADVGDCYFALDGTRALEMAAALQPDLLLLDIDMPGIDGFEICARLKAEPQGVALAVAFVTQFAHADNEARAFDSGADDFIAKPFDSSVLQARVRRLIDRKRRVDADLEAVRAHWQGLGDARVAEIVAAASDAIVVADHQGRIALANRAACTMFGVPAGTAVGAPLRNFLPSLDEAGSAAARQPVRRADGSELTVEVVGSSVGAGLDRLHTCVLRDTRARDLEEAVARQRAEAEAARRATAAMLAFIAHEIGNSLNAVVGFAQLAAGDAGAPLPAVQALRIEHIARAGLQLQALMRDVIDLNRVEAGKFRVEVELVDPAPLVLKVCAELGTQAEQAGARFHNDLPSQALHIRADARRLQQCVHNLVSNAIKYGRPAGCIDVAVREQGSDVLIEIRDDGPGLSDEQLAHLFEPYNRLGREGSSSPGTGLGLLLTRELALGMGGKLEVERAVGAGSCFTLRFPRITPQA